jgi:hypothetical protein
MYLHRGILMMQHRFYLEAAILAGHEEFHLFVTTTQRMKLPVYHGLHLAAVGSLEAFGLNLSIL